MRTYRDTRAEERDSSSFLDVENSSDEQSEEEEGEDDDEEEEGEEEEEENGESVKTKKKEEGGDQECDDQEVLPPIDDLDDVVSRQEDKFVFDPRNTSNASDSSDTNLSGYSTDSDFGLFDDDSFSIANGTFLGVERRRCIILSVLHLFKYKDGFSMGVPKEIEVGSHINTTSMNHLHQLKKSFQDFGVEFGSSFHPDYERINLSEEIKNPASFIFVVFHINRSTKNKNVGLRKIRKEFHKKIYKTYRKELSKLEDDERDMSLRFQHFEDIFKKCVVVDQPLCVEIFDEDAFVMFMRCDHINVIVKDGFQDVFCFDFEIPSQHEHYFDELPIVMFPLEGMEYRKETYEGTVITNFGRCREVPRLMKKSRNFSVSPFKDLVVEFFRDLVKDEQYFSEEVEGEKDDDDGKGTKRGDPDPTIMERRKKVDSFVRFFISKIEQYFGCGVYQIHVNFNNSQSQPDNVSQDLATQNIITDITKSLNSLTSLFVELISKGETLTSVDEYPKILDDYYELVRERHSLKTLVEDGFNFIAKRSLHSCFIEFSKKEKEEERKKVLSEIFPEYMNDVREKYVEDVKCENLLREEINLLISFFFYGKKYITRTDRKRVHGIISSESGTFHETLASELFSTFRFLRFFDGKEKEEETFRRMVKFFEKKQYSKSTKLARVDVKVFMSQCIKYRPWYRSFIGPVVIGCSASPLFLKLSPEEEKEERARIRKILEQKKKRRKRNQQRDVVVVYGYVVHSDEVLQVSKELRNHKEYMNFLGSHVMMNSTVKEIEHYKATGKRLSKGKSGCGTGVKKIEEEEEDLKN